MKHTTPQHSSPNRVVGNDFKSSKNFFHSDLIFREYLNRKVSQAGLSYIGDKLEPLGKLAAREMDGLSRDADKNPPQLNKRNFFGEDIDEVEFHPSYNRLMKIAVESEMFTVKWKPDLRKRFNHERHRLGFASGYLYAMSELGQYCPLCMTDGVARLIDRHCSDKDRDRLLPHIYTGNVDNLYTGAMFLTEKRGGSDVGRNIVRAEKLDGDLYELTGEKWFCSNVNAGLIFALARTDPKVKGTRGLSIFLIEKQKPDGSKNPLPIIRLKDKLGVRSMASAECMLDGTVGKLVGEEFQGFKIMTDMINLSRLYNSVAALAGSRRALVEAYNFLLYRETFGKRAIEHALVRDKLYELGSLHVANFYLTWRAIEALDNADNGDEESKELVRLLTPMVKKWSAEKGVYIVRESMELMGGIGYIEDGVVPRIMRDIMVLPIWEGAGNIMTLDMIRAAGKSSGLEVAFGEIESTIGKNREFDEIIQSTLENMRKEAAILFKLEKDNLEYRGKRFFEKLTTLFQLSMLISQLNEANSRWLYASANFLKSQLSGKESASPPGVSDIEDLIGWNI